MDLRRREFLGGATALAMAGAQAAAAEEPLLRIGAMTDNHLHANRPETHRKTRACFELFRRENVDIVVDTGDIADLSHVDQLEFFRACFDELFAGTATVPFFLVANHDYNYLPNTKRNDPAVIARAVAALKMSSANPCLEVKGHQFASFFQDEKIDVLEANVRKAVERNVGNRPVFVVTHVPPFGTTTDTEHWSSAAIRKVLDKYPQVVSLTGHIHTAITWAANVWQGTFTSINLGAHAQYSNPIEGEATILDVYADRIDVRRYEAVSGREIGADDRWSIPLPLDPARGPYRPEVRAKARPVPEFPAGATVCFVPDKSGIGGGLRFPSAKPGLTRRYRVRIDARGEDGAWRFLCTQNWTPPQVLEAPGELTCPVTAAMLEAGREHRATVTPMNSLRREGRPLVALFQVPESPLTALPDEVVRIEAVRAGRSAKGPEAHPDADGWYSLKGFNFALLSEAFAATVAGRSGALVFDIGSDQKDVPNTFSLARIPASGGAIELGFGSRIYTESGTMPTHRYSWRISGKKLEKGDRVALVVREGSPARFRFNSVRCLVTQL